MWPEGRWSILFAIINITLLLPPWVRVSAPNSAPHGYSMAWDAAAHYQAFFGSQPRPNSEQQCFICGWHGLAGAFTLSYGLGAELLNFGALIAFMGVNIAAFVYYYVQGRNRSWSYGVPPLLGFAVCCYISSA